MRIRNLRWIIVSVVLAGASALVLAPLSVRAQAGTPGRAKPGQPRNQTTTSRAPREVTLTGRVVSVHAYMTGQIDEESAKATTDSLRAGGAAALETPQGLILLGQGNTGGMRLLLPLAHQQVEAHGRIYDKGGLKFMDFDIVRAVPDEEEAAEEGEEEEEVGGDE
jgi:hypothetical protein